MSRDTERDGFSKHMSSSGIFVPSTVAALDEAPIVLSNPGNLFPFEQNVVQRWTWAEKRDALQYLKPKEQPWAEFSDFVDYSRAIIKIAESLLQFSPHCCLGPLRGASVPASLTGMTAFGKVAFDYFDYRNRKRPGRWSEISKELRTIIDRRNPREPIFRLALLDCAIGGHGVNALVPLLKTIWRETPCYRAQAWDVDVHLLHDTRKGTNTKAMRAVARFPIAERDIFDIRVHLHEVPKLVTEDYSPALAFEWDQEARLYAPSVQPGTVFLVKNQEVMQIYSSNAFLLYKQLFIEGVRRALETDPLYRLERVVWKGR